MRTPLLVGVVVAVHCVAVGSVLLIQGCGTTTGTVTPLPVEDRVRPMPMPPSTVKSVPVKPAAISTRPRPRVLPAESTEYVIRKGDTLSGIAVRFGVRSSDIMAINGITNPNKIFSGQKIMLPGKVNINKPAAVVAKPVTAAVAGGNTYVVKSGDCLSGIAVAHGITTAELKEANGLSSDMIRVGQKLALPGGAKTTQTAPVIAVPDAQPVPNKVPEKPAATDNASAVTAPDAADAAPAATGIAPSAKIKMHIVGDDEDLYTIAMTYAVSTSAIKELNNLTSDKIEKGMKLQIPITED